MFGKKAVGTVVGIASAGDFSTAMITGEILFKFDKMLGHKIII